MYVHGCVFKCVGEGSERMRVCVCVFARACTHAYVAVRACERGCSCVRVCVIKGVRVCARISSKFHISMNAINPMFEVTFSLEID